MSRYFPHTAYAEDQPLAHTILYTHVLTRGVTLGSLIGTGVGASILGLRTFGVLKSAANLSPASLILRSSGNGVLIATGLMALAVPGRMFGREEIEWKDRSWRLMENKGQLETDDWTYGSMGVAALAVATRGRHLSWKAAVGAVGLGSVAGMFGHMGWRYGVKGGKVGEQSL